jgi:hypothetical protein
MITMAYKVVGELLFPIRVVHESDYMFCRERLLGLYPGLRIIWLVGHTSLKRVMYLLIYSTTRQRSFVEETTNVLCGNHERPWWEL